MAKKELPEKMFYSITEVAQYYNVNESTLRFWEKEFDLIAPKRSDNKRKIRSYTAQDVQNIGLIYHLLKEQGLTLSGAKEKLRKKPGKTENNYEILSRLRSIRAEIVSICRELDSQMRKNADTENAIDTGKSCNTSATIPQYPRIPKMQTIRKGGSDETSFSADSDGTHQSKRPT